MNEVTVPPPPVRERFTVRLVTDIPKSWLEELQEAARVNGQSVSAIVRLALRSFLGERRS